MRQDLRLRPGNPRNGKHLLPEDFYTIERPSLVIFSEEIHVGAYTYGSNTLIIETPLGDTFCVTIYEKKTIRDKTIVTKYRVCLPNDTLGKEILFISPHYTGRVE